MLRRLLTSACALGLMAGGGLTAEAAMHATPEFEAGTTRPRTIAFLPPQAMLIKQKIVQTEQQLEESGQTQLVIVLPQGGLTSQFGKGGTTDFDAG